GTGAEFPGAYPFTRGVHPSGYRGRHWTMRQYAGYGNAEETNRRYRFLLERGQTGLSVAFDLPTQMGYDSDHPLAAGEVGKSGVAISTVEDFETLFAGIPLDQVSISMTINATAPILLGMALVAAERRGIGFDKLTGTVQNDLLKEYVARGTYIYPPRPSLRLAADLMAFAARSVPKWNSISVSGYHMREAGATAAQELGFTLANGTAYVAEALARGVEVNALGARISFFFGCHNCFLEEVAKFRAARRLWARIMKERFGATDPRAQMLRFHTQTAGVTLTAQQPENNVVRVALQALAAVLGGTQSLHTNSRDEALCLPTEESARLALRTQQVLAYELGVADTVDPLGGSYLIEELTARLEELAGGYLRKVEELGGAVRAVEAGYFSQEIEKAAWAEQRAIERGEKLIVGVNRFADEAPAGGRCAGAGLSLLKGDPELQAARARALAAHRAARPAEPVRAALAALEAAARGDANLLPPILDALRARATLGEISDALRTVFGVYRPRL
ncbi:MAG: methylmalonyl-CoA mutase, partial [Planctomycetes bacterium]|nr:methylmalonyl-CoA mutase [Planctomycetota bacterium]